jgi:hypothetical protein
MKTWRVVGEVTISVHTEVEAETEAEAREKALDHGMQQFCHSCCNDQEETWTTSGELDGEITKIVECYDAEGDPE